MPNRIATIIQQGTHNKLLVPFFTAGYPSAKETVSLVLAAEDAGVDMVEIGIPFSDPLADGPDIQFSSKAALDRHVTLREIWSLVEQIRDKSEIPLLFMGYYNPLLAYGEERFLKISKKAGLDGFIIPDLPVDEAGSILEIAQKQELASVFLVSPTSSDDRIKQIDRFSSGFVYAVTVTGVTGTGKKFDNSTDRYLISLKKKLRNKFVAGFGVSSVASAKRLADNSDGIVIGSKLVQIIRNSKRKQKRTIEVNRFLSQVRKAIG